VRPIDLGRVRFTERAGAETISREELFVNCLGAGFDGLVAMLAPRYKWIGGNGAYLAAVLRSLRLWKKPHVTVTEAAGDTLYAGPLYFISVCNGYSIGGGFLMTPDAEPDDGVLDLCLVRGMPVWRVLRLLPQTFSGAHVGAKEVIMRRIEYLSATASAPLPMQADGEVISQGADSIEVEVLPAAMTALTPGRR
jgi:diacylglycerol kinase family enzyme